MDVELFWGCESDVCVDVGIACADLSMGNDLSTAIMLSLFTDRRANKDDTLPDGLDPRGWWSDAMDGEQIGSRLWLLERARNLTETFRLAEEYAKEALQWLVEDGVVSTVTVNAIPQVGVDCANVLALHVGIKKPDGKSLSWRYRYAWDLSKVVECEQTQDYCA